MSEVSSGLWTCWGGGGSIAHLAPRHRFCRNLSSALPGFCTPTCRRFWSSGSLWCTLVFWSEISQSQLRTQGEKKQKINSTDKAVNVVGIVMVTSMSGTRMLGERYCLTNRPKLNFQLKLLTRLTYVFLDAKLQFLAFHLLDFLIVEFVPVSGVSVLHVSDVVARICADAPMDQHRA